MNKLPTQLESLVQKESRIVYTCMCNGIYRAHWAHEALPNALSLFSLSPSPSPASLSLSLSLSDG